METHGRIGPAEASAALASAERSRARVAWTGYPAWYWLTTAAGLALLPLTTLPPAWLGVAICLAVGIVLTRLAVAVNRARGVCEGWTGSAMRAREVAVLYGPSAAVLLAGAFTARLAWWAPIAAGVLVFVLFAGTALTLGARAARP
ncbi:MAG TPA: hypothetical protein VGX25_01940 [Actinophytocola sp.]|uniref:hypothetical protein n=1 Tax=Actinophytocola sp. TaxID=1872138 RepID=UPI002DDCDFA5|nr:hypothetical protein [Actinophytocola sp.]HEV2778139.1 hypothetical protein [Actinophytocola sp.]